VETQLGEVHALITLNRNEWKTQSDSKLNHDTDVGITPSAILDATATLLRINRPSGFES